MPGLPREVDPNKASVDPYLLASRLTDDAAIAYHAALQFHGKTYSVCSGRPLTCANRQGCGKRDILKVFSSYI